MSMTFDHVGQYLLPEVEVLRFVGRLAWPLFALLVGVNIGARRVPAVKYLPRLWFFAVPAQIVGLALGWSEASILVTLALGVMLWGVMRGELRGWWLLALVLAPFTQYGIAGVALVPVLASLSMVYRVEVAALALALVLISQGSLFWAVGTYLALVVTLAWVVGLVAGLRWLNGFYQLPRLRVGRLPRWAGYGYYPAHLAVIALVATAGG